MATLVAVPVAREPVLARLRLPVMVAVACWPMVAVVTALEVALKLTLPGEVNVVEALTV